MTCRGLTSEFFAVYAVTCVTGRFSLTERRTGLRAASRAPQVRNRRFWDLWLLLRRPLSVEHQRPPGTGRFKIVLALVLDLFEHPYRQCGSHIRA